MKKEWEDDEECRIISEKPLIVIVNPKYDRLTECLVCGKPIPFSELCPACGR